MCNVTEFVEVNDDVGNVRKFESHEFWAFHWCVEIKIFDVNCHEIGIFGRDDTVEDNFDGDHVCSGYATVAREVNLITADREPNAIGVFFFREKVSHNTSIRDILPVVLREACFVDETMVSVPLMMPGMPCASRLISFPYAFLQMSRYLGLATRCQYSINSPVLSLRNAWSMSVG